MVENTKANILTTENMGSVLLPGQIDADTQESGAMGSKMGKAHSLPKLASKKRGDGTWANAFAGSIPP